MPGPSWLAFTVLFILLGSLAHVGFWAAGVQPLGSFSIDIFLNQLWIVAVLFFHDFLDRDAKRALNESRPLMNASDEQFTRDLYAFTNLPAKPVLLLTLIGVPIALYIHPGISLELPLRVTTPWSLVLVGVISMSLALVFSYRIIRQVLTISQFYSRASAIDLYDLEPVYALSSHAARTGLTLLLAVYANIVISPEALEFSPLLILVILLTLLASAAFLLPLRGINRRLVEEKRKLLQLTQRRIKKAFEQIEDSFDATDLGAISTLHSAVSALQNQKAFIENIPTWPWQASTLRGFISFLLLPIFIWAAQQILSRLFDL
ncbi:MAG: hypothetical protein GTO14_09895 [Anaerolineales bacterium]|nr:hypothetical protein [Anaerolineales bacterium]